MPEKIKAVIKARGWGQLIIHSNFFFVNEFHKNLPQL